jgi:thiol-disulfide isomerase/thioredoxin
LKAGIIYNDYDKSISFVRNHIDNTLLDILYKDENFKSNYYKDHLIADQWLTYLLHLDYKKDSTLRKQKNYDLKKIYDVYSGKAREFALHSNLTYKIRHSKSLESISNLEEQYELFASTFKNTAYKDNLAFLIQEKKVELLRVQVGQPAPTFTLENTSGKTFNLEDFRNKVVYLDLWASWCIPCIEEIPFLKDLYNKYKDDDRIVFISIAVLDRYNDWKKILEVEKPGWLQLFDKEGTVAKAYNINAVPQFILIDKQGKFVDFYAPYPSDGKELEVLLEREILK